MSFAKFSNLMLPFQKIGYARRAASGWTYSPATIDILRQYMEQFPDVFKAIGRTGSMPYLFSDLWPEKKYSGFSFSYDKFEFIFFQVESYSDSF